MTFVALVDSFSTQLEMPVRIDSVIEWITERTDHKDIRLHAVKRSKQAFRGAFRRRSVPSSGAVPYSSEFDIITEILYADDLSEDWKRLVICKELLHIFDPENERVSTRDSVRKLITVVLSPDLKGSRFYPGVNDRIGAFKAMAVLMPRVVRHRLKPSFEDGSRSVAEIAQFVGLPLHYVDIWLRDGDLLEDMLCDR